MRHIESTAYGFHTAWLIESIDIPSFNAHLNQILTNSYPHIFAPNTGSVLLYERECWPTIIFGQVVNVDVPSLHAFARGEVKVAGHLHRIHANVRNVGLSMYTHTSIGPCHQECSVWWYLADLQVSIHVAPVPSVKFNHQHFLCLTCHQTLLDSVQVWNGPPLVLVRLQS